MSNAKFEICTRWNQYPIGDIKLPERSTAHAAGYDFFAPADIDIMPGEQKMIWTDIKVKLAPNQFLMLLPRSSYGVKKHLKMSNTCGIVDSDYYNNSDNEGNIGICLYNYNASFVENHKMHQHCQDGFVTYDEQIFNELTAHIKKGDRIAQGIIMTYDTAIDDVNNGVRGGGFGSTGE